MSLRPGRVVAVVAALVLVAGALTAVAFVVPRYLRAKRSVRQLESVVADLRSSDANVRSKAAERLRALQKDGLPAEAGLLALRSAAGSFPEGEDVEEGGSLLVAAAAERPTQAYAPLVEAHFAQYSPEARFWALRLLANMEGGGGAESVLAILRHHAAECEEVDLSTAIGPMVPDAAGKLFPELLEYLRDERLRIYVAYLAYDAVSQGHIPDSSLIPYVEPLLALYMKEREVLVPRQRTEGHRWMWEEDYLAARDHAGLLLDLFGEIPSHHIRSELARAMTDYTDPKLLAFAAVSMVRQGAPVASETLERIAGDAEVRNKLYELLERSGRADLFPSRYKTQEAFAESALVSWLVYPTELGQVPDHIELMKVVTSGKPGEEEDFYVFRFRMDEPHWAANDGWMAGVAGGFSHRAQPTTTSNGSTFSSFAAWDSQTAEGHLREVTGVIGTAWKAKAKEVKGDQTP